MESRLTAVVTAQGAEKATNLLDKFATSADGADNSVDELTGGIKKTSGALPKLSNNTDRAVKKLKLLDKAANDSGKRVSGASSKIKNLGSSTAQAIAAIDGPLGGISSRVSSLTSLLKGGAGAFGLITATAVGFGAVLAVGAKNLDDYDVNLRRVDATIRATGEGVGFTANELQKQAEVLAIATLTSVEEVQKAQAKLITFNRVLGDEFKRTVNAAQDLAEAGFGTIESNVITLGKALQDPATGMASLTRVGITLSEQQKQLAKDALAVGDVFAAQEVILKAVEGQVKGVAEAVADGTLAGIADSAGIAWDRFTRNLAENQGALNVWKETVSVTANALNALADGLENATAGESFDKLLDDTQALYDAQQKLSTLSPNARTNSEYGRQIELVNRLKKEVEEGRAQTIATAKAEGDEIRATTAAREKEAAARIKIVEDAKKLADEELAIENKKAAAKKEIEDKREQANKDRVARALQREVEAAQARVTALQAANDTELESIQQQSEAKFQQAALDAENGLIQLEEYLTAKNEITKTRDEELRSYLKDQEDKDLKRKLEQNEQLIAGTEKVSDSLIDAALSGKSLGSSLKSTFRDMASDYIKATARQFLQDQIISRASGALFTVEKTAEVGATVAQAGLNALASTAAIPVIGPALAPAAAASMTAIASGLGSAVIGASAAREQGGQTFSGQTILAGERGAELITTESNARVINAKDTANIMNGGSGGNTVNLTVIDQSTGNKEFTQETTNGETVLLIRDIVSSDFQNPNSQITRGAISGLDTSVRR